MKAISITTILLLSLSSVALAGVIATDANVEKLSSAFSFTEGPAADPKGNVYFTDQPNDKIYIWTTEGKLTTFLTGCERSNGMYFDADGVTLLACADLHNRIVAFAPDGKMTVVVEKYKGKKMILRFFDDTAGTYMVLSGNASLKDIGGLSRFIAIGLSGNDVWQQQDYMTGSGSIRMMLDLKATKSANIQSKTVTQLIESYEQILEQTKGYIPE
jgi:DNA-binding beta-propeller fold protein YncE